MGIHQQHSKPATQPYTPPSSLPLTNNTNMKFFAIFALFVLGFALVFGQSVSPSTSPAAASASPSNSPTAASPAASASASPVIVNPSISPIIVASNAPIYYPVIYTYDTSAASGPAPFKFF